MDRGFVVFCSFGVGSAGNAEPHTTLPSKGVCMVSRPGADRNRFVSSRTLRVDILILRVHANTLAL